MLGDSNIVSNINITHNFRRVASLSSNVPGFIKWRIVVMNFVSIVSHAAIEFKNLYQSIQSHVRIESKNKVN